jgi:hypothetical protein
MIKNNSFLNNDGSHQEIVIANLDLSDNFILL